MSEQKHPQLDTEHAIPTYAEQLDALIKRDADTGEVFARAFADAAEGRLAMDRPNPDRPGETMSIPVSPDALKAQFSGITVELNRKGSNPLETRLLLTRAGGLRDTFDAVMALPEDSPARIQAIEKMHEIATSDDSEVDDITYERAPEAPVEQPTLLPVQSELAAVSIAASGIELPVEKHISEEVESEIEVVDEDLEQQEIAERRQLEAAIEELNRSERLVGSSFDALKEKATQLAHRGQDYPTGSVLGLLSEMTYQIQRATSFARNAIEHAHAVGKMLEKKNNSEEAGAVTRQLASRMNSVTALAGEYHGRIDEIERFVRQGIPIEEQMHGLARRAMTTAEDYAKTLSAKITA